MLMIYKINMFTFALYQTAYMNLVKVDIETDNVIIKCISNIAFFPVSAGKLENLLKKWLKSSLMTSSGCLKEVFKTSCAHWDGVNSHSEHAVYLYFTYLHACVFI